MKKKILLLALALLCLLLTACGGQTQPGSAADPQQSERTVLTGLYYEALPAFEALVESTYSDIDLQLERSAMATYNGDTLRRLKNGAGKDLVFTFTPHGEIAGYVQDMSSHNFTTRFADSMMSILRNQGKTEFLPLPGVYRGVVINETLVKELGFELPATRPQLRAILDAAKAAGVGVDENGYGFAAGNIDAIYLGEIIMGTCISDFLGTMEGERWMADFHEGRASAQGVLNGYVQHFADLALEGYIDADYLYKVTTKTYVNSVEELADRTLLASFGSSSVLNDVRARNTRDTFTMLPYMSADGAPGWITANPVAYLGINAALTDADKLDAALRVLDLFASPEGQAAIMKDTRADTSYLTQDVTGVSQGDTGVEQCVADGYVYNLSRFNSDVLWALGKHISQVCAGNMTMDDALAAVDAVNRGAPLSDKDDRTLLGSVSETLVYEGYNTRKEETAIGNLIADAVREFTGADFVFVNGGGIRASLYQGDVYTSDLAEVLPYDNYPAVLEVTGETVFAMLENSISTLYYNAIPGGRFLQVSGLHYTFSVDPSTEVNEAGKETPSAARLLSVTLPDGTPVDREAVYTVCVNDYMAGSAGYDNAGDGYTMLNVLDDSSPKSDRVTLVKLHEETFRQALISYFENHSSENIGAVLEGRITVKNAGDTE